MKANWRWTALLGGLLLAGPLSSQLSAQTFLGQVTAMIEDEQGAAVPGANVTLRNEQTGETRVKVASSTGAAVFPNLLVGEYTVMVELTGFKKYERRGVAVKANSTVDVHARLAVGGVEEVLTVVGGSELVNTTSSQLEGITFNAKQLTGLPADTTNGDVTNFGVLAPGVGTQPGGVVGQGGVIGGNRPRNNSFVVDGLDNNDSELTGAVAIPIQDSVEQFQLITNQFNAEFGHSTAGQFITATKGGTNQLSGGIWAYNINRHYLSLDNLTAATAAGDPNFEKPRYDRNRVGGQLGGPIVKDKLFFYGAYEYQDLTLGASAPAQILAPTAAGLAILQGLANTPGTGVSPVMVGLLRDHVPPSANATDVETVTDGRTGQQVAIPLGPFAGTTPNYTRAKVAQFNVDANLGASQRLNLRGFWSKTGSILPGPLPTEEFNADFSNEIKRGTLSWVWTVQSNFINEFRSGYHNLVKGWAVTLPAPPGGSDIFGNYALDEIGLEIGPNSNYPQTADQGVLQFADTGTFIKGAHTFKAGVDFRMITSTAGFLPRARGEYRYESLDQFVRDTIPTGLALRGAGSDAFIGDHNAFYGFLQDTWQVSPRLTLDLGLRYEWSGVPQDVAAQDLNALANVDLRTQRNAAGQVIFDTLTPAHQALLLQEFPSGQVTFQKSKSDTNNWAPRVGFAWDIKGDGRSSLRGGFGMAYDVYFGNLDTLQLPPQFQLETNLDIACVLSPRPNWCAVPPANVSYNTVGFQGGGAILPTIDPTASTDPVAARSGTQAYVYPQVVNPMTYTWSASYQRQLSTDYVVEVRYIGTMSKDLPLQRRLNGGIPDPVALPIFANPAEALSQNYAGAPNLQQFNDARTSLLGAYGFDGNLTAFSPLGESNYNGGSISLTRRLANGIGFNVNYTLSKVTDNGENELFTSLLNPRRNMNLWDVNGNDGLSGLNKTHKAVLTFQWEIGKSTNRLLGGWVLGGLFLFETGQGLTIQSIRDQDGNLDTTGDRAFFNPNGAADTGTDSSFVCFSGGRNFVSGTAAGCGSNSNVVGYVANDPNAQWVRGQAGAQRGVGLELSQRGAVSGPGNIHSLNLSLYKNTRLGGRANLRIGVTCSNCTNSPSFALGTGIGTVYNQTAALTNRAFVTPGTAAFLDPTTFSGSLGASPFQRIIALEAKVTF